MLPQRSARRHAQPGVPPDRGAGRGRGADDGRPARGDHGLRPGDVRRGPAHQAAARLLPVHRAVRRRVDAMSRLPWRVGQPRRAAVPCLQVTGLDRDRRLRHGQPPRSRGVRHRPRPLQRLRVRTRHRAVAADQEWPDRHQRRDRGRRQVQHGVRIGGVMLIPLSWLLEYAPLPEPVDVGEVARRLTGIGLEIEAIEQVGHDISGVVVARVLEIEEVTGHKKPIRYCRVTSGDDAGDTGDSPRLDTAERWVICGAVNFDVGDMVPLAIPGARLPRGHEIGASKRYGRVSDGMICSAAELGLGDDHTGIMVLPPDAPLGADFVAYAGLRDVVLDVNVTPDKGHALSVRGMARELASAFGVAYTDPADDGLPAWVGEPGDPGVVYPASIADPTACDRFALREVRAINPGVRTPLAILVRLARADTRSVSLAVDVTNYLTIELGQPLHAFDRSKLDGPIVVRRARPGERLETLDHVVRELDPDDILITDSSGPISMAGTMGGLATEITEDSRDLVIEAAHFSAPGTARMSRRHRLFSEASYRFEREVDRELPVRASAKTAALLAELGGATVIPGCSHAQVEVPPVTIRMPADYPGKVAGLPYPQATVIQRLRDVGCVVTEPGEGAGPPAAAGSGGDAAAAQSAGARSAGMNRHLRRDSGKHESGPEILTVVPPSWRQDLRYPSDLAEEVIRLEGYDNVPVRMP